MNKKGNVPGIVWVVGVSLLAFMGLITANMLGYIGGKEATITTPSGEVVNVASTPSVQLSCPTSKYTVGKFRTQDNLATTLTYLASEQAYYAPKEGVSLSGLTPVRVGDSTSVSSGAFSTGGNLLCGATYKSVVITNLNDYTSAECTRYKGTAKGEELLANGAEINFDCSQKSVAPLALRFRDIEVGAYTYLGTNGTETSDGSVTNSTGFATIGGNNAAGGSVMMEVGVATASGGNTVGKTLGSDGYLDYAIEIKANETKTVNGEDGLRAGFCVDTSTSIWQEPSVWVEGLNNNAVIPNIKTSLTSEDQKVLGDYEYCYEFGQTTGDAYRVIHYYQKAKSGVNPAAGDAPILRFWTEGRYASNKDVDKVVIGIFDDSSSNTELAFTQKQTLKFNIA